MAGQNMAQFADLEIDYKKIDTLWVQDLAQAKAALMEAKDEYKFLTKIDEKTIEAYAVKKGELTKYIRERVFPSVGDGYYVVQDGELVLMSSKVFSTKLKLKLATKNKAIVDASIYNSDGLYKCDVFNTNVTIDTEKKRINLARRFNFEYNPNANISAENKEKGEKILFFFKEVICGNKDDQHACVLDILTCAAHRLQSQVVLFLCALAGVGKTFFADIISALFGSAFASVNEQVLSGECQFNKVLIGSVFAVLEETAGTENYKRLMRAIKQLSTEKKFMAREMYIDGYPVTNLINIIILSNFFKDIDVGNRRVLTPDIDNKYQGNKEYFRALSECMTQEALQYVFNYIYSRKIPQVPLEIPMTMSKRMYIEANMHSVVKFLIEKYMFISKEEQEKQEKKKEQNIRVEQKMTELWEQYMNYCMTTKTYGLAKYHEFAFEVKQYAVHRIIKGTDLYDVSYNTLYDRIITRSKIVTPERFEQMKQEYFEKNNCVHDDEDVTEVFRPEAKSIEIQTEAKNEDKQIKKLNSKLEKKKKRILELNDETDELETKLEKKDKRIEELEARVAELEKLLNKPKEIKEEPKESKKPKLTEEQKHKGLAEGWKSLQKILTY